MPHHHFTIFEHQSLWVHKGKQRLNPTQLLHLQHFHGEKGVPYYSLIHQGVRFCEYVGVLQIGDLTIEILPKADQYTSVNQWRDILIGMLRSVNAFNVQAPSQSSLDIKSNYILDLYFELFVKEVEYLFHQGLIKKYGRVEQNQLALKGALKFAQQIQKNLIHQERFYTQHTIYDSNHLLNQIVYKTLLLVKRVNHNVALNSRISTLLMRFPPLDQVQVTTTTFEKIILTRKSKPYQNILEICKLLLLNYHPDLRKGKHVVLALLFDMNVLWERFILKSIQKHLKHGSVRGQAKKLFWKPQAGYRSTMRPDIVITLNNGKKIVLDTKWKNIQNGNPSAEDLRQLYVYHEYFKAEKVALIYPGAYSIRKGNFYEKSQNTLSSKECCIIKIPTNQRISVWQQKIYYGIFNWIK